MSSEEDALYACLCLNVRLSEEKQRNNGQSPLSDADSSQYKSLYVGDGGIKIIHTELTLRSRSPVSVDPAGRQTQYTTLTCLVCGTPVYRVKTELPPDSDAKEGPVLPSEDWTQKDALLSKSGWVSVHVGVDGCIEKDEIKQKSTSSSYSPQFAIVLPSEPTSHSVSPPPNLHSSRTAIPPTHDFLPGLGPFLPPPPFTSSHPIFLYLASIASEHSKSARSMTASCIEDFTKQQLARLEETEDRLRAELEKLWFSLRQSLKKAEMERDGEMAPTSPRDRRRSMSPGSRSLSPSMGTVGSPRIQGFALDHSSGGSKRPLNPAHQRSQSALSASIVTSGFHHPRAQQENTSGQRQFLSPSPPPYTSNPSSSASSSGSANGASGVDIARPLRRNMNEENDTAVTYRFFAIEEQEAARRKAKEASKNASEKEKKESGSALKAEGNREATGKTASQATTKVTKGIKTNGVAEDKKVKEGKRKVKFDVEPAVVTIKRDVKEDEEEPIPERGEDLLFEYDDDDASANGHRADATGPEEPELSLPTRPSIEPSVSHESIQTGSRRPDQNEGLPQSFAALRPSSLPAPSHVRPPIRPNQNGKSKSHVASSPVLSAPKKIKDKERRGSNSGPEVALSPQQQDIRKLVGGDTPVHRNSWRADSESWKIFEGNEDNMDKQEDEEDEFENEQSEVISTGINGDIARSLPITMPPMVAKQLASFASSPPKTTLTTVPEGEILESERQKSAAASRRKVYAERNRIREMDPGMLDYTDDAVDTPGASPELERKEDVGEISKSRQHAFNIIKARNSVPAEGLWRSLA